MDRTMLILTGILHYLYRGRERKRNRKRNGLEGEKEAVRKGKPQQWMSGSFISSSPPSPPPPLPPEHSSTLNGPILMWLLLFFYLILFLFLPAHWPVSLQIWSKIPLFPSIATESVEWSRPCWTKPSQCTHFWRREKKSGTILFELWRTDGKWQ